MRSDAGRENTLIRIITVNQLRHIWNNYSSVLFFSLFFVLVKYVFTPSSCLWFSNLALLSASINLAWKICGVLTSLALSLFLSPVIDAGSCGPFNTVCFLFCWCVPVIPSLQLCPHSKKPRQARRSQYNTGMCWRNESMINAIYFDNICNY